MGQGVSQLFDNLTYNPDVRRQKAADQKDAAKTRDIYRETLTELQTNIQTDSASGTITPDGATLMQGVVDTGMTWLQKNPSALSDSIDAQSQITMDSITEQINADKIRIVFFNSLKLWNYTLLQLQNQNLVSADKAAQFQKVLDQNQVWYTKNLTSPLAVLQKQIGTIVESATSILNEPAAIQEIQQKATASEKADGSNLNELMIQAAAAKAEKEKLEESQFSGDRVKQKIWDQTISGLFTMLYLVIGLYTGSLVASDSLIRPMSIRIVYFIYAVLLWFVVLPYYLYRSYTSHPPFMGAYLFPIYPYNPDEVKKDSFFEQLIWYKDLPLIKKAQEDYIAAAEAILAAQKSIG
jgi:hypothetical protein